MSGNTPWPGWSARVPRIHPLALAVVRRGEQVLVVVGQDRAKQQTFYRPPGGHIEFGELGAAAVVREIREELHCGLEAVRFIGFLENLFTYRGKPGHELVLLYDGRLDDGSFYERESFSGVEGEFEFECVWRSPQEAAAEGRPLYPDGLAELLATRP